MGRPIRLLIVEDVEDHALLVVRELQKGGMDTSFQRVESPEELQAALDAATWDAIISDYNLPAFTGIDALRLVQGKGLDVPFLLISGAIGEEKAAEVMKAGAHDYIKKGNYARLVPTLERELRDAAVRAERRQSAEELSRYREHLEELVQERTAQLHAEKQEREQALLQLEAVLGSITEGVIVSDLDGNVLSMNSEALALHQYESVDEVHQNLAEFQQMFELLDLEDRPVPHEQWPLARALRGERFVDWELQVRRKDTGKLWIGSYSGMPVCNQEGAYCLMVVTVRDITEKKRAEGELRKSERKFSKIFNASPTLIGILSLPDERIVDINDRALEILQYERDEIIGRAPADLGIWGSEADHDSAMRLLAEQGFVRDLEIEFRGRSGETRVGLFSSELIELDNDNYLLAIVADITQRKRYEQEIVRAKQEWEQTFDSVPDLISIIDDKYRIVRVNRALAERLGREPQECVGIPCYSAIHGTEEEPAFCPHKYTEADKTEHDGLMLEPLLKGQFMVTTTPLAQDGDTSGVVFVARDITERVRAEQQITQLNEELAGRIAELEERNLELEAFNRMISHDLRQPLNSVALACQAIDLFCRDSDQNCKDAILMAHKGVLGMNNLIKALLTFAQSTHGELSRQSFDIAEMVRDIVSELRSSEPGRVAAINVPDQVIVDADPGLMRAVLNNLIGNAWKYTSKRELSIIEFGVTQVNGDETYYVRDNGRGFSMDDADHLFIPFRRLPGTEEFSGSGIGLATVERIIRRHGGRVWAESEPDRGATFYFTLRPPRLPPHQ